MQLISSRLYVEMLVLLQDVINGLGEIEVVFDAEVCSYLDCDQTVVHPAQGHLLLP